MSRTGQKTADELLELTEEGEKVRKRVRFLFRLLVTINALHLLAAIKFNMYPIGRLICLVLFNLLLIGVDIYFESNMQHDLQEKIAATHESDEEQTEHSN